jgi:type III secretion protein J
VSAALVRSSLPRTLGRALVLLAALLLSACETELYNNLDQRQANEIVATLQQRGIPAQRVTVKGGTYTVVVDKGRFAESVTILKDAGLPRQEFQTMGQVFKKDGLVSSPTQERAQMIFALSQELSRTVSEIDGVLSARVHLVLPENDPLRQQLVPSSASVFVRHRSNARVGNLVPQVKMLVANGVAGLAYDKVSVILVPVDSQAPTQGQDLEMASFFGIWMQRDNVAQAMWMFFGLVALVVVLAGGLGVVLFRRRRRVYALGSSSVVKTGSSSVAKAGSSNVVKMS